jgi:acyl carrier protein
MVSQEEIFTKVQGCLVDALGVEEDEVTPEATLAGDLGAESIDYLDIIFRVEKAFGIKIDRSEMFPEDIFNNPTYVKDGRLTPEGLQLLKERLPFADLDRFEADPQVADLRDLFTVQMIVNYVAGKLSAAA